MHWTIISGTNRPHSNTLKVTKHLAQKLRSKISKSESVEILNLLDLPAEIFLSSAYEKRPASFSIFQECISKTDGLISVIPEYNGSAPGVFKYFIDMLSFPDSLMKKPCVFVGLAAGRFGGLRAVEQMQQVFMYRKAYIYPESLFIKEVDQQLNEDGSPKDPFILKLMDNILDGFVNFARQMKDQKNS